MPRKFNSGFTLAELMIVLAILVTLAAIANINYSQFIKRAKIARAKAELRTIDKEIAVYWNLKGVLPESLDDLGLGEFKDPWGNNYRYLKILGEGNQIKGKARKDRFLVPVNSDYDLYSMGPDGQSVPPFTARVSRDDIVRANDGKYFGTASGF